MTKSKYGDPGPPNPARFSASADEIEPLTLKRSVITTTVEYPDAQTQLAASSARHGRFKSQVTEVVNRNTVVSLALQLGYNAYLPVYDAGIDLVLHRESDDRLYKVQLKGRWMIDKKYVDRGIWMAFPILKQWYLMPHEQMLVLATKFRYTETQSWIEGGAYSLKKPSIQMITECRKYKFGSIATVDDAALEDQ